jgi:uracil-DNA glycosylase
MLADLLPDNWRQLLANELNQPYFVGIEQQYNAAIAEGRRVFPPKNQLFKAFECVAPEAVHVLILGQDPYHGPGQAHGLAFSVTAGIKAPPSLRNILKEVVADTGQTHLLTNDLSPWAKQGVLLLNSLLTVEADHAGAHQGWGWETFTDAVIRLIANQNKPIVFMLWGKYAHKKAALVNQTQHLVLKAAHPSPLSAYQGFMGCRHFSTANDFLKKHGLPSIQW